MPVSILDKPAGQLMLPGLQLDLWQIPDGAEIVQCICIATARPNWRFSDTNFGPMAGPVPAMRGLVLTGALYVVVPGEVLTINAGQCFCWGSDDDVTDIFCATDTIFYDMQPAGLAQFVTSTA